MELPEGFTSSEEKTTALISSDLDITSSLGRGTLSFGGLPHLSTLSAIVPTCSPLLFLGCQVTCPHCSHSPLEHACHFFPIATSWVPIPSPAFPAKLASAHISKEPSHVIIRVVSRTKSLTGTSWVPWRLLPASDGPCSLALQSDASTGLLQWTQGHRSGIWPSPCSHGPSRLSPLIRISHHSHPAGSSLWHFPASFSPASGTQGSSGELTASKGHLRAAPDPGPAS